MSYKVLNLYAGIGGNRKLWTDCEVTAVEINPEIAAIYQDFFPDDIVIIGDAHEYLLNHFKEFDFIWSSPPCPSHSKMRMMASKRGDYLPIYPDMKLYSEIVFLDNFFKGKHIVENVESYYKPLIFPQKSGRHFFWANFKIPNIKNKQLGIKENKVKDYEIMHNVDLSKYKLDNKLKCLRNCVYSEIGKAIFDRARNIQIEQNIPQGKLIF